MTFGLAGGGNVKSWKTLRVQRSGLNWMGKISTSTIYVIYISRTDLLSLGDMGGVIQKNQKKKSYF